VYWGSHQPGHDGGLLDAGKMFGGLYGESSICRRGERGFGDTPRPNCARSRYDAQVWLLNDGFMCGS